MLSLTEGPESKKARNDTVLVDALPYIDNEYEETGMKELVAEMIEEEKRRYRPIKNYLEHLPALELHRFETEIIKNEYERISQHLPMETLSMKRYELPPPPPGKLMDITAWSECLDNSFAQLEHQSTRIANLELMQECGTEGWKSYLTILNRMVKQVQAQHQTLKREIQELNWSRKSGQVKAGEELQRLQDSWVTLVSKNYELELACQSKELIKYQKSAELAQLKFIVTDAQSDRSGSRIRRRVRRFFLQQEERLGDTANSTTDDTPQEDALEEEDDEDAGAGSSSSDSDTVQEPDTVTNAVAVPIEFEGQDADEMDTEGGQGQEQSDDEEVSDDEDDDRRPPPSAGIEEEIGPQPFQETVEQEDGSEESNENDIGSGIH